MKKVIGLSLVLTLVAAGAWFGLAAWHAHNNLVTLDVRSMPLRDAVRKIERQTWEHIHLDKRLEGNVTLKLKNVPLAEALDRVAEITGARAQTFHAVHRSDYALKRLQTALQNGEEIAAAGWTNLAPRSAGAGLVGSLKVGELLQQSLAQGSSGGTSTVSGPGTISLRGRAPAGGDLEKVIQQQLAEIGLGKLIPKDAIADALKQAAVGSNGVAVTGSPRVQVMTMGPDGKLQTSDGSELPAAMRDALSKAMQQGALGTNGGPGGVQMIMSSPIVSVKKAGPDGTLEEVEPGILSAEGIVIETALNEQFANDVPATPTREAAEQAARKVKGRCTTLHTLVKSDLPAGIGRELKGLAGKGLSAGPDGKSLDPAAMADRFAQAMQREKAEQYLKLTPEQRVQRARNLRTLSGSGNTNP